MKTPTDINRWSQTDRLDPNWDRRAEFALSPVAKGLAVVDIGCGLQAVRHISKASTYLGIDVVARDTKTHVIDLNEDLLPANILRDYELVTAFGLIEYLQDPEQLLQSISDAGLNLVLTYKIRCDGDTVDRHSLGWVNDFSESEIKSAVEDAGLTIVHESYFDKSEIILYAAPKGYLFPWKDGLNQPKKQKKRIVLSGFFGRGNCGDEALLQSAYQAFSPDFDITISVDMTGSVDGFWDWYPYNQCELIHQCQNTIGSRYSAYIICGGGLPIGFVANQIMAAQMSGVRTYCLSVDPPDESSLSNSIRKSVVDRYYSSFDHVHFRTPLKYSLPSLESRINTNGDLALLLEPDASGLEPMPETVLITLREWDISDTHPEYVGAVLRTVAQVKMAGLKPVWFPFAPEDTRFLKALKIDSICEILESWWNPMRAMEYIASAAGTISIGRLHPLIFSVKAGGNAASLEIHTTGRLGPSQGKIANICHMLGIPQITDYTQLEAWVQETKSGTKNAQLLDPVIIEQLNASIIHIKEEILNGH